MGYVHTIKNYSGVRQMSNRCHGPIVCLDCPRLGREPPYRYFILPLHYKEHTQKKQGHRIVQLCDTCGRKHSLGLVKLGWGGRRVGAGAPKHNLNALRSGRRVTDPALRDLMHGLSPTQRQLMAQYLRSNMRRDNGPD